MAETKTDRASVIAELEAKAQANKDTGTRQVTDKEDGMKPEVAGAPAVKIEKNEPYSVCKAVRGMLDRTSWEAGSIERDVHNVLADRAKENPDDLLRAGKVILPWNSRQSASLVKRVMYTWDDSKAGALVQPDRGELIELLRHKLVLTQAGVRQIQIGGGGITFPRLKSGVTTYWVDEGAPISPSDLGLGKLSLKPHKLAAAMYIPKEAITDTNPSLEALVREDMAQAFASAEENAFFFGTGGGAQPRGYINDPDINTEVDSSVGAPLLSDLLALMKAVENNKGNPAEGAFITFPNVKYAFLGERAGALNTQDAAVYTVGPYMLTMDPKNPTVPMFQGIPILTTTNISGTDPQDIIAFGIWSQYLIARAEGLMIEASSEYKFLDDVITLKATERVDMGARQPSLFKFSGGVTAS